MAMGLGAVACRPMAVLGQRRPLVMPARGLAIGTRMSRRGRLAPPGRRFTRAAMQETSPKNPGDDETAAAALEAEQGDEEYYEYGEGEEEYYEGEGYYEEEEGDGVDYSRPFPAEIPMDGSTKALAALPLPLYYGAVLAAAGAAGAAGVSIGRGMPVEPAHRDVVAYAVGAAAAGAAAYAGARAKKVRDRAAVVDLFNLLVGMDEAADLSPDQVKAVGDRYGIDMRKDQLEGLQQLFAQYLEAAVPKGEGAQLTGDEAPRVAAFRDALGLTDEECAPAFIKVGRRLSRASLETKDRQGAFEARKAFQRLVYLSYCVLGDQKAAFLLPWRRVFGLNDAQLFVARRDNAREVFARRIAGEFGGELPADRAALRELRDYQTAAARLTDDAAADAVRAASRARVERHLNDAVEALRAPLKSRDMTKVTAAVAEMLEYGRKLAALAGEDDLVPGVGLPSLAGGEWAGGLKAREARDVFRAYADEASGREGAFTPAVDADLKDLAAMLSLPARDAAAARGEVAAALYRRLLKDEVASRRLDAAPSPAKVLGELVAKSGVGPEVAAELHKTLYRQKLAALATKKRLNDADGADLARVRRILCIPDAAAADAAKATTGRAVEEVVSEALLAGVRPLTEPELARVDAAVKDLKLDRPVAKEVFAEAARARLKAMAGQAVKDLQNDKRAAAVGLKRLVQFNSLVVAPLLERVAGTEAAKKELAELMAKAAEEAKKEEDAKKAEEAAKKAAGGGEEAEASSSDDKAAAEASSSSTSSEVQAVEAEVVDGSSSASASSSIPAAAADAAASTSSSSAEAASSSKREGGGDGPVVEAESTPVPAAEAAADAAKQQQDQQQQKQQEEAAAALAKKEKPPGDEAVQAVAKAIAAQRGEFGEDEKRHQKEVTLAADVDPKIRAELYKTYLMYAMSGDVVELPVGGVVRKRSAGADRAAEMQRLQHLSDVLGMNQLEVAAVHQDLSEQAFKAQAQDALRAPGPLTPERTAYLEDLRKQLSLPEDKAQKIIREIRTEVVGAAAALEEAGGEKWTAERALQAAKDGVDVAKALEEPARRSLLRREMSKRLTDGAAKFDANTLLVELPKVLGIEQKRVDALVRELVGSRKRMLLVQAVSQHRQKRSSDAVTSLNNLISAYRAAPEAGGVGAVQWGEKQELRELFGAFCAKVADAATRDELGALFGIDASEREELARAAGAPAAAGGDGDGEDEDIFI